jgi:hypothetical protein
MKDAEFWPESWPAGDHGGGVGANPALGRSRQATSLRNVDPASSTIPGW